MPHQGDGEVDPSFHAPGEFIHFALLRSLGSPINSRFAIA